MALKPSAIIPKKRAKILPSSLPTTHANRRNRPERGKFTILDGVEVAAPDEILDLDFTPDLLQKIFQDSRIG